MAPLFLYGDTETSASMRHEIPLAIGDPFLLALDGDRMWIMCSGLERERLAAVCPSAELLDIDDLGFYELLESGLSRDQLMLELTSRAAARTGITDATVEFEFPLGLAERLRQDGITLTVDDEAIKARRRAKSGVELAGIRRAQAAAQAAMQAAADLLARARPAGERLEVDGEVLTAERVRAVLRDLCWHQGTLLGPEAIVASVWQGFGHEPGRGPLPAGLRTGPGEDSSEGFQFSLGHGVGLEVHEDPGLGQTGRSPLVPGDVIAVEPGLWEREVGGVRFEDLLLITEDGCEVLTDFPYELDPQR